MAFKNKIKKWFPKKEVESQKVSKEITQVYLELSTHCNLSCKTCMRRHIHNFTQIHIPISRIETILQKLKTLQNLQRIVIFGFGEPLCHPDIKYVLQELGELGIPLTIVSNGFLWDRDIRDIFLNGTFSHVYFSWDDPINSNTPMIRTGADLNRNLENIKALLKEKKISGKTIPTIGMETVATLTNHLSVPEILLFWKEQGVDEFIVSNIFPYTKDMEKEILYTADEKGLPPVDLSETTSPHKIPNIRIAGQMVHTNRSCPFIEKGTVFISAEGNVVPCPELAYTHEAVYTGDQRIHHVYCIGHIDTENLEDIFQKQEFEDFRALFRWFEFPDCFKCFQPETCNHRFIPQGNCFEHFAPCGECLWARGIIICP